MYIRIIITSLLLVIAVVSIQAQCSGNCIGSNTSYGENTGTIGNGITFFGKQTGASNELQGVYNTFMGYQTGFSNKFGTDNSFFGTQSGFHNESGSRNSFFGRLAGEFNTADDNSFFGYIAGDSTNTGNSNSFFGSKSGRNNTTGNSNSFFGIESGSQNKGGNSNSFYGAFSGKGNISGGGNSFYGISSGVENQTGNNNSYYGANAGSNNVSGGANSFFGYNAGQGKNSGSANSFFGLGAGQFNDFGNRNSFFGTNAGNRLSGSYNIAIGNESGPPQTNGVVDSSLYIDIQYTHDPLIYGQFNKRIVRINGSFEAMGGIANSSDVNRKEEIVSIDERRILEKVAVLELSEWSYKDVSDVRHLGPMAQDFYKAFGLGKNDTTIGTLDADGVALAAIQGLYQLWQEEKKRNDQLEKKVERLFDKIEQLDN